MNLEYAIVSLFEVHYMGKGNTFQPYSNGLECTYISLNLYHEYLKYLIYSISGLFYLLPFPEHYKSWELEKGTFTHLYTCTEVANEVITPMGFY